MKITSSLQRHLRGLSHHLKPVVMIGQKGLTESVIAELTEALAHHELIKVKVSAGDRVERDDIIMRLCRDADAHLVHRIGHVAVLFKRNHEEPKLELPKS